MTRLEAKKNRAKARADLASVKADDADPLKRLSELVESSMLKDLQAAEAKAVEVKKAVETRRQTKGRK